MNFDELYKNAYAEINPTPELISSIKDMAMEEIYKRNSYSFPRKFIPATASALIITVAILVIPHLTPNGKFNETMSIKPDLIAEISVIEENNTTYEVDNYDNVEEIQSQEQNTTVKPIVKEDNKSSSTVIFEEKYEKQFDAIRGGRSSHQETVDEDNILNDTSGIENNVSPLEYGDYSQWPDESLWDSFSSDLWLFESPNVNLLDEEEILPSASTGDEQIEIPQIEYTEEIEEISEDKELEEKVEDKDDSYATSPGYENLGEFLSENINSGILIEEVSYFYNEFIITSSPELLDTKVILSMLVANKKASVTDIPPMKDFYIKIKLNLNRKDILLTVYSNDVITVGDNGEPAFKLKSGDSNKLLLLIRAAS